MLDQHIRAAYDMMLAHPQHRLPWTLRRAIYDLLRADAARSKHKTCEWLAFLAARKVLPIVLEKMALTLNPNLYLQNLAIRSIALTESILAKNKQAVEGGHSLLRDAYYISATRADEESE